MYICIWVINVFMYTHITIRYIYKYIINVDLKSTPPQTSLHKIICVQKDLRKQHLPKKCERRAKIFFCMILVSSFKFVNRVDLNLANICPECSSSDRSVSFLVYSSTKTNSTVSSYQTYFVDWMKCVQKYQKIARCWRCAVYYMVPDLWSPPNLAHPLWNDPV